jgi:hypothetical protein
MHIEVGAPVSRKFTATIPARTAGETVAFQFPFPRTKVNSRTEVDLAYTFSLGPGDTVVVARQGLLTPVWHVRELPGPFAIDADLGKWAPFTPYVFNTADSVVQKDAWTADDISADVYMGHYRGDLYFAFRVQDDTHFQDQTGYTIWKGDCIQMAFDLHHDRTAYYDGNDMEIGLALGNDGAAQSFTWLHYTDGAIRLGDAVEYAIRRAGTTTCYEVKIPLSKLADPAISARKWFGFAFTVNDHDGADLAGGIIGAQGLWGGYKNPAHFGTLVLP